MNFRLPSERYLLEQINLPDELIDSISGQTVKIEAFPERVTDKGRRVALYFFTDSEGGVWQLPRRWFDPVSQEPRLDPFFAVSQEVELNEWFSPPTYFDLLDINMTDPAATWATGDVMFVRVRLVPGEPGKVFWRDPEGGVWRLPFDWRLRRVMLPATVILAAQGVPVNVAERFGGEIVSVNYHPGSLCCLPDAYRFRDGEGGKWPVKIEDCTLVGLGDKAEHRV
jgi:hypothetical protein